MKEDLLETMELDQLFNWIIVVYSWLFGKNLNDIRFRPYLLFYCLVHF